MEEGLENLSLLFGGPAACDLVFHPRMVMLLAAGNTLSISRIYDVQVVGVFFCSMYRRFLS